MRDEYPTPAWGLALAVSLGAGLVVGLLLMLEANAQPSAPTTSTTVLSTTIPAAFVSPTTLIPYVEEVPTTTLPPTTTTTLPPTTTTTVPPPPAWKPSDECRRVTRAIPPRMMRWCPAVADYLYRAELKLPGEQWKPGTLTMLLAVWDCESRGNPTARHPRSGAFGIPQHLPKYWEARAAYTARFFEFDNPNINYPLDQIAVGVALYLGVGEQGGIQHWTCAARIGY